MPDASLLPPHSTDAERAVEASLRRMLPGSLSFADLWSADRCPAHLLAYLAQALSVDHWEPDWPEARKRAAIRAAVATHRRKGTREAVGGALAVAGIRILITEWWQTGGRPHTMRAHVDSRDVLALTPAEQGDYYRLALRIIEQTKPVHVHASVVLAERHEPKAYAASGQRLRLVERTPVRAAPEAVAMHLAPRACAGARMRALFLPHVAPRIA